MTDKNKLRGVIALFIIAVFAVSSCDKKPQKLTGSLRSLEEIKAYLNSYAKSEIGNSPDNPLFLPVALEGGLGKMTDEDSPWQQLLKIIYDTGTYVNLDLSLCEIGRDGTFDMSDYLDRNRIVILTLPQTAVNLQHKMLFNNREFKFYTNLKSIKGENIVQIGKCAFWGMRNLEIADFPSAESVEVIAFYKCEKLTSLNIPRVITINDNAFFGTNLTAVDFPEAVTIGDSAFEECKKITNVYLPKAQHIKQKAFTACSALRSVNLPNLKSIGGIAFSECRQLKEISFPASAEIIGRVFQNCESLVSFNLSGEGDLSVIEDGKVLVKHYNNEIELVSYPSAKDEIKISNVTKIASGAFWNCKELKSVDFPDVTIIGESVFEGCDNLESVSFSSLKKINRLAFQGLENLSFADFPSVLTIEENAFRACENLSVIKIPSIQYIESEAFAFEVYFDSEFDLSTINITFGLSSPNLGTNILIGEKRTINVLVPQGASGYGKVPATYEGDDNEQNWANGLRGKGWDGHTGGYNVGAVNSKITVNVMFIE